MNEYNMIVNRMEKRRKARKVKRIEKEIRKEEFFEVIGFFSFPILVLAALFI